MFVWKQEAAAAGGRTPLRCVILDLSPVPHVDATAVRPHQTGRPDNSMPRMVMAIAQEGDTSNSAYDDRTRAAGRRLGCQRKLPQRAMQRSCWWAPLFCLTLRAQVRMLSELADGLRRRRLRFVISNPSERVFAMLDRSGLLDTIGALVTCSTMMQAALHARPSFCMAGVSGVHRLS